MRTFSIVVVSSYVALGAWTSSCSERAASDGGDGDAGVAAGSRDASDGASEESLACEPRAEDAECELCTRSSCCRQLEKYGDAADATMFEACIGPCEDQACVDGCAEASPVAGAAYDGLGACQIDSCATPCICEASSEDSGCLACVKDECCSDLVPYAMAPDFDGFSTCMEPCEDTTCADGCIAAFPGAGPAYRVYSECAFERCPAECQ
jgi:hypothetical protein